MKQTRFEQLLDKKLGLARRYDTAIMRVVAALLGIAVGAGTTFAGLPLFRRGGGQIRIGERVSLVSRSDATALGVCRPVILRCLTANASIDISDETGLSGTVVCAAMSVTIGKRCLIGADVTIFDTDFHQHEPEGRRYSIPDWPRISAPVVIGDGVFDGTGAVVQKGVTIGNGAILAVRSVLTKDVPERSVVGGNPAMLLRGR